MKLIIYFFNTYKNIIFIFLACILVIVVVKRCENAPKTETKTKVNIEWIKDSLREVIINEIEPVYIDTGSTKYIKGDKLITWRDSIIYVDKPSKTTIKANQFETILKSNNATANLKITSTGQVLDVLGTIEYPETTITNTTAKTRAKSGLFVYADVPINKNSIDVGGGLMYQFKNTLLLKGGVQYNDFTKTIDLRVGLGIKIF
jgi:hypothetical protein